MDIAIPHLVGGFSLPLWKMMEFVSWDDDIPNICNNKFCVPNHQPDVYIYIYMMGYTQLWSFNSQTKAYNDI